MTYLQPFVGLLLALTAAGLIGMRRCKGVLFPSAALAALFLWSWPPVSWLLSRPLETPYPVGNARPVGVQALVVLASSTEPARPERPYPLPDEATYRRCEYAAWLFRETGGLPILACGGGGGKGRAAFSSVMRELLQRAGVPPNMIWTEERSGSTHENAVYGAQILRSRGIGRIALIVEAQSMLRAERCFRKEGIAVTPAPCAFRQIRLLPQNLIPSWTAIRANEITIHEEAGLVTYWVRGWI